jgi:hypothetical protein
LPLRQNRGVVRGVEGPGRGVSRLSADLLDLLDQVVQVNRELESQGVVGLLPVAPEQTADALDPFEECVGVDVQGAGGAGQIAGVGVGFTMARHILGRAALTATAQTPA